MKHNTEMDLLLRRHARRAGRGVSAEPDVRHQDGARGASHLDADELSAYAEGVVPESARTRYVAHLAECDDCRKIVSAIVISSGTVVEEKRGLVQTVSEPRPSWREWLAAFLSPPVLRYAVPALALASILAIVFVVARRDRESTVARNEGAQTNANVKVDKVTTGSDDTKNASGETSEQHGAQPSANVSTGAAEQERTAAADPAQLKTDPEQIARAKPTGQENQPGVVTGGTGTADSQPPVAAPQPAPKETARADDARRTEPPSVTSVPADADAVGGKVMKEKDENQLAAQKRRERQEGATGGGAPAAGAANSRAQREEKTISGADAGSNETVTVNKQQNAPGRRAPLASSRTARDTAEGREDEGTETRSVAGRTFRRQGSVWVDTSYNSSRSVTRVRRGSEQYRALVGDEPVVGTVANALGGDVILVVKGRAYRLY